MLRLSIQAACFAMALALQAGGHADAQDSAQDSIHDRANGMRPPRLVSAEIDWTAALATLAAIAELHGALLAANTPSAQSDADRAVPEPVAKLNAVMAQRFPGVATSPVPVLAPLDTPALLHDLIAGTAAIDDSRHMSGFRNSGFFYPGPAGYDAAFTLRVSDVAEFSDVKQTEPIEVQISGSALVYELDGPTPTGKPVPELEAEFPGIKRLMYEYHLRYTFVRYGVPYVVSIGCFDGRVSRYRLPTCRVADRVALRLIRSLHIVGGTPQPRRVAEPHPIERPATLSPLFRYRSPGKLLSGTGFRDLGGSADYTVYSRIRFPLAHAPAYANSQMFQRRNPTPNFDYPWRDNFCERRGFPVGQCPAGIGHQGQDIRPAACSPQPCRPYDQIVAVRDGAILRSPVQEAAYLFVNTATEHIRFRYLHMDPRKMTADGLLSGRLVLEGDVIGEVSNFSKRENGTSYHLHFDVQVPTRNGWVFVNPYMTLVASYERLIDARGTELDDAAIAATGEPDKVAAVEPPQRRARVRNVKRSRHVSRDHRHTVRSYKHKRYGRHRLARR